MTLWWWMVFMLDIRKIIFILVLLCCSRLYSYDYPWPVEYEIKKDSIYEINNIITKFIHEDSKFQTYDYDSGEYSRRRLKGSDESIKNELYRINLEKREWEPFGKVLCGSIFLEDVNAVVGFYVPYVSGSQKTYIRLVSYSRKFEKDGKKIVIIRGISKLFNDVEPTKNEIPIKESFEKNFMSKLPLEWEYVKPAAIDRRLSKLLSFFRKRKNFSDD